MLPESSFDSHKNEEDPKKWKKVDVENYHQLTASLHSLTFFFSTHSLTHSHLTSNGASSIRAPGEEIKGYARTNDVVVVLPVAKTQEKNDRIKNNC